MTSSWTHLGGYLDFNSYNEAAAPEVIRWWVVGATVGCTSMCLGLFYIIQEWCKQSFMATISYPSAMAGLNTRRRYMRLTYPARQVSRTATLLLRLARASLAGLLLGRRLPVRVVELSWTKDHRQVADRIADVVEEGLSSDNETARTDSRDLGVGEREGEGKEEVEVLSEKERADSTGSVS